MQKAGFIILPPEHDPDSLIKAEGAEGFERQIEKAYGLTDFMKKLLLEGKELMYAEERAKLVAEAKPWVLSMQHAPILRLAFIRELAGIARLQADDIERQYGSPAPLPPGRPSMAAGSRAVAALPAGVTTAFHAGPRSPHPSLEFASRTLGSACSSASFPILIS